MIAPTCGCFDQRKRRNGGFMRRSSQAGVAGVSTRISSTVSRAIPYIGLVCAAPVMPTASAFSLAATPNNIPFAVSCVLALLLGTSSICSEATTKFGPKFACASDLASCPSHGCADSDSDLSPADQIAEGLLNARKRATPRNGSPVNLTFDDFVELQVQTDTLVGQERLLSAEQRDMLRELKQ